MIIIRKLIFLHLKGSNAYRISVEFILMSRFFNRIPLHFKMYQTIVEIKHAAKTSKNSGADKVISTLYIHIIFIKLECIIISHIYERIFGKIFLLGLSI